MSRNLVEDILVSIVIPVFNGEKYLKECLDSVISQSYKNIEVLVVDDGSTDNSQEIINDYVLIDSRIKYYKKDHSGLLDTRRYGVDRALGEYVMFVDCDDYLNENAVEYVVSHSEKGTVELVCFLFYRNNRNSIPDGLYTHDEMMEQAGRLIFDMREGIPGLNQSLCTKAFRKELLGKTLSGIDTRITLGEDAAVSYIAALLAKLVFISSEGLYFYRYNSESMCHTENVKQFEDIYFFRQYMKRKLSIYDEKYFFEKQLNAYIFVLLTIPIRNCFSVNFTSNMVLPRKCFENGMNIRLFGAGVIGKRYYDKLTDLGGNVVAWLDSNMAGETICGRLIEAPDNISLYSYDSVIIAIKDKKSIDVVTEFLYSKNVPDKRIYNMSDVAGTMNWREIELLI